MLDKFFADLLNVHIAMHKLDVISWQIRNLIGGAMIRRKISMRSQAVAIVLAGLTIMVGGEYVRAASHVFGTELTGSINVASSVGPAELDPAFQQKLLERARGHYERTHPLGAQTN
jgi:hypothetical protein